MKTNSRNENYNVWDGKIILISINSRLDIAGEKISEQEDIEMETNSNIQRKFN